MDLTSMERRKRILELAEADEEYRKIKAYYEQAKADFERFTMSLPDDQRNLLNAYPGMGYFLHHRLLTIICSNMAFEDEER